MELGVPRDLSIDPDFYRRNLTSPTRCYFEEQPWAPLSCGISDWDINFHTLLCSDKMHVEAYKNAIQRAISTLLQGAPAQLCVLDVGTGSGILLNYVIDWHEEYRARRTNVLSILSALKPTPRFARLTRECLSTRWGRDYQKAL